MPFGYPFVPPPPSSNIPDEERTHETHTLIIDSEDMEDVPTDEVDTFLYTRIAEKAQRLMKERRKVRSVSLQHIEGNAADGSEDYIHIIFICDQVF